MTPEDELYLEQLKRDAESVGGSLFQIRSNTPSMLGTGYAGNTVVVLPRMEYGVGKDVVFKAGPNKTHKNLLHRVVAVKPGYVYTKGTFNTHGDGWIPVADVLGEVTQVVKTRDK